MTLAYAAGWIIIPGALLGLWLAVRRPRSTEELAFGVVALLVTVALFLEAGFLQASLTSVHEIQERYVFYAAPCSDCPSPSMPPGLAVASAASRACGGARARLGPRASGRLCGRIDPERFAHLFGVYWLTGKLGKPGDASAVVAAAVALMTAVAVLGSRRPRFGRRSCSASPCLRPVPHRPAR
jgi:hypothetical protein